MDDTLQDESADPDENLKTQKRGENPQRAQTVGTDSGRTLSLQRKNSVSNTTNFLKMG